MPVSFSGINFKSLLENNLLSKINLRRSSIPPNSFGSIDIIGDELHFTHTKKGKLTLHRKVLNNEVPEDKLSEEIKNILSKINHKVVATSLVEKSLYEKIAPKLWLEEDIVSYFISDARHNDFFTIEDRIKTITSNFNKDNIANIKLKENNEVIVTDLVSLEDYKKVSSEEEFKRLLKLAKEFAGKKLTFINATPQGGGVALMRHSLMRLFKLLNVDAHWYILKPNPDVFNITKRKFHNILQAVADPSLELTEADENLYNLWIEDNAGLFNQVFKESDVLVMDDPQPSGLIPYIKKTNPKAKIIYRSHIQIESELANKVGTPQYKTWQFIWNNIKTSDAFVSHPILKFVPDTVNKEKLIFMPATTDPLDGLNKPLTKSQRDYYFKVFNKLLKETRQKPLDTKRPYIIQIARFDPSKGIPDVLESYKILCNKLKENSKKLPQLVICGNGSVDDPDGIPVFNQVINIINSSDYKKIKNDIKVARLPHIDQLLNTLLRDSKVVLQLSIKEGFEIKVTEALMKGKPVVIYKTGGMPLQIKDKINGFIVEPGDFEKVSEHLFNLLTDNIMYNHMSWAAESYYDKSLLTTPNAIRWLSLSLQLLTEE